ncbi:gluconokinase, GntK/IdnK-type [Erwinia sorbitola]|uniref:Gluconokinase n=1 Tax=Erwinia sorbitola TaxID=2681984 RepID=A0A6I6ESG0_9GAMM|nr:gluconokinase, GntK/IdnK-type [Erwinia sorbitola]MTD29404.1 AAA family ATPase [Erwinia sorbitola]QGU89771.1 AAA family ATPase [Erwinia sorbitola]
MGVSGCGKSAVAQSLAAQSGIPCLDGDFLHPRHNVDKMAAGDALDDNDRLPWLQALNDAAYAMLRTNTTSLMVCSALKKRYRDMLRHGNSGLHFIFLNGSHDVIKERLRKRKGHYFREDMLDSQFRDLEMPSIDEKDIVIINIERPLEQVVAECINKIQGS